MAFSFQQALDVLLDEKQSLNARAVVLFEFQVAIFFPTSSRRRSQARRFAAMKLLENRESVLSLQGPELSFVERAKDPDYLEILSMFLGDADGWRAIRKLPRDKS